MNCAGPAQRAVAHLYAGRHDEALYICRDALRLAPDSAFLLCAYGMTLLAEKQFEAAMRALDRAVGIHPGLSDAWYNRGLCQLRIGRVKVAICSFDQALILNPSEAGAWANRALALSEIALYRQSLPSFERALSLRPDYAKAWSNRGVALAHLGRLREALACFTRATEIAPGVSDYEMNRTTAEVLIRRHTERRSVNRSELSPSTSGQQYNLVVR